MIIPSFNIKVLPAGIHNILFIPFAGRHLNIMKKLTVLLVTFLVWSFNLHSQVDKRSFVLGVNTMYRYIEPGYSYFYPRLSLEFRLTRVSSFEFMTEYINYKSYRRFISFPLSAGYKLNIIPWFTKNEKFTDRLRVYGAMRYTFLPCSANPDKPFEKFYVFHEIRFAPGVEYFFNQRFGLNIEMVFGKNKNNSFGLGVKYLL